MTVKAPPIYEVLADDGGKAMLPWILFFNQVYEGDKGTSWTPTFTSLTEVGTPSFSGRYYRLSQSLVYFRFTITPGTNTSATAGTTYVNNFPLTMRGDGICFAVSGNLGTASGMCDRATNRVYVPGWSAVTVPLSVIGLVEAN